MLPLDAFYRFPLAEEMAMPGDHAKPPEPLPELHRIVVRNGTRELLVSAITRELAIAILPAWLLFRRWFAVKGETPHEVRIGAHATLPDAGGDGAPAEAKETLDLHSA
jgi:maltose alpha-D-glucosyltransferase/alpha-amylase